MTLIRMILARLASAFSRGALDDRIDEEIETHLALAIEDGVARGMTPAEARTAALRAFGGVTQTREAHRDVRRLPIVETVYEDVKYALRGYRRTPGFTTVALVTLTLAIGINTGLFSLLYALLLRDVAVRDPQSLVQVVTTAPDSIYQSGLTYAMFRDLRQRQTVFTSLIGWGWTVSNIESAGGSTSAVVAAVSGEYYSELAGAPVAGRLLTSGDVDEAGLRPNMVAVVSHRFWLRHLGGNPGAIGERIVVEGTPFTVVGVAPEQFAGLLLTMQPDVVVPLTAYPLLFRGVPSSLSRPRASFWVRTTGRLKPGVSLAQARAALDVIWPDLKAAHVPSDFSPAQRGGFLSTRLSVQSAAKGIEPALRSKFTRPLLIVFAIALSIVMLASVNLAGLMLARTASRGHELGVRVALGAGRRRLVQQLVTEGVLLALAGAIPAIIFAGWSSRLLVRIILQDYIVPASLSIAPDLRVIAFVTGVTLTMGIVVSLGSAWQAAGSRPIDALQRKSRTFTSTGRLGRVLVGAQVTLSFVLVMNSGLLVRSLQQVRSVPSGMRPDGVTVVYTSALPGGYEGLDNDTYYQTVVERVRAIGIQNVAVSLFKPAGGGIGGGTRVTRADTSESTDRGRQALEGAISPGFFQTLGITVRAGRDFRWTDNSRAAGVAIISETLARHLFPGGDALGRRVRVGTSPAQQSLEVVGIVGDARVYDLKDPNVAAVYVAALQQPDPDGKCFVLRGGIPPVVTLNAAIEGLGQEHVSGVQTLTYITDRVLLDDRLSAGLAGVFGLVALLLSAIGLYGLLSYAVAQRAREFGIRLALGAAPVRLTAEVVRDGIGVTVGGLCAGFVLAAGAVHLIRSQLFGITPYDPLTTVATPIALLTVAIVACLVPALRAARVDPLTALRAE
jgi:predicted permease